MKDQQDENPTYEVVYIFEIQECLDKLEGHGAYQTVGFISDERIAQKMAHINPVYPGRVVRRPAVHTNDNRFYLLLDTSPVFVNTTEEELEKTIALAKLTPQERALLGLQ